MAGGCARRCSRAPHWRRSLGAPSISIERGLSQRSQNKWRRRGRRATLGKTRLVYDRGSPTRVVDDSAEWFYLPRDCNTDIIMATTVTVKGQVTLPKTVRE